MYQYVCGLVDCPRRQKGVGVSDLLKLHLQVFVSHRTWTLRSKLGLVLFKGGIALLTAEPTF